MIVSRIIFQFLNFSLYCLMNRPKLINWLQWNNSTHLLRDGVFITSNPRSFTRVLGWCWYTTVVGLHHKLNVILAVWTRKMKVRLGYSWFIPTGCITVLVISEFCITLWQEMLSYKAQGQPNEEAALLPAQYRHYRAVTSNVRVVHYLPPQKNEKKVHDRRNFLITSWQAMLN